MASYLIVGNGIAGTTAAENIRKLDKEGIIRILSDEDLLFYYRIRLNEYISGDIDEQVLIAKKEAWYKDRGIDILLQTRIISSDPQEKVVISENNERFAYDYLLIATGSHSFVPPISGSNKKGVFALRSIQDARGIASYAKGIEHVVLIGGGLLGLEAGNALRKLGKNVTVVEFFPRLLPRQLDVNGAKRLQGIMEEMGFTFKLGAKTQEIMGKDQVTTVLLEGGEKLAADMVIISAGVRPNLELAEPLGLEYDKGIKVDGQLRTNRANVFAAGDVVEFQGMLYGIWPAAMEQGKIAGTNMAGGDAVYHGTTMANTLKVVGIDLASAGNIDAEDQFESKIVIDEKFYKKVVIQNNQIIGCIMLGDTKGFDKITKALSEKQDVSQLKDKILLGGI